MGHIAGHIVPAYDADQHCIRTHGTLYSKIIHHMREVHNTYTLTYMDG